MKKFGKENDTLDALSHFLASSSIIEMIKAKVFPKVSEKWQKCVLSVRMPENTRLLNLQCVFSMCIICII
jgi:hypothetical protein